MTGNQLDTDLRKAITKAARKSDLPIAIVINTGDANSYGVVVNLGRAGVPVIAVSSNPDNITFRSRYASKVICPDYERSEEAFVAFIADLGKRISPKPVLFVNGDEQLMVLLRHREQLEPYYHIPLAPYELAEKLTDKTSFYRMLEEHGAPYAKTYLPESIADVEALADELQYPYIIKPSQSQTFSTNFGNKCLQIESKTALLSIYKKVSAVENDIIIQKQLLGSERYLVYTYFSEQSKPLGLNAYKKVRIFPTDFGNACVCKTIADQEVVDMFLGLLRKINYRGLAEAEIQRDASDGQLKFVEVNARTTAQSRLSERSGVNMEHIAYRHILGMKVDPMVNTEPDILWIDLYRDLLSVFSAGGYLSQKKITVNEWRKSLQGKRVFTFFSWDDPAPSIILFFRLFRMHAFKKKRLLDIANTFTKLLNRKTTG